MKKIYLPIIIIIITMTTLYVAYQARSPSTLIVSFLDVGQGDAIFIQSPSGVQMLVDGGPDNSVLEEIHSVMPLFDRSIDIIVATHPDSDHISGIIEVIDRFSVGVFLESGAQNENGVQDILNKKIRDKKIPTRIVRRGEVYDLGSGVTFSILYPNKDVSKAESNSGSIIARLSYGEHSFLLTGDAPVESELLVVGADEDSLRSTVLKLGHHGSDTSTSATFMSRVKPQYSIVSAGKNNKYNHPHPNVVERVEKFGSILLKTEDMGTITFSTNGKVIEVLDFLEDFQVKKFE